MADQSLATQDQRLTAQDSDSKMRRARRLLSPKAILPWVLVLWTIVKFVYQSLNLASVVEFAAGLGRNPNVKTVLDFILSPWGQVLTTLLGIAWLTYLVLKPQKAKDETSERVENKMPASPPSPEKPIIEILSPFDHDQVGLYETVRGRVFPPHQELQVAVLAGDKWYQQKPVIVRGSTWSVKCKFGRLDKPDKGPYKVVALLGNELKEGILYPDLPTDISKSNVITVHRLEVTIEQELLTARSERDNYKEQIQTQAIEAPSIVPCGEELLHNFADSDRGWIDKAVLIVGIDPQPEGLSRGAPYIEFEFLIYNSSVFPVLIDDSISGYITYREGSHERKLDLHISLERSAAKNIPARGEGHFTVTQHLLTTQADLFRNRNDITFSFDHLVIKVKGWNESDKIITQELNTRSKPCGTMERYLYYEPKAAQAYANMPFVQVEKIKAELEEEKRKVKPDIHGEIKEVFFEKEINLETSLVVSQDCYHYHWFYVRLYVANYAAAKTVERYRLLLKTKDGIHEGQRVPLKGFSLRNAVNDRLIEDSLIDIEDQNDVALEHTRNGWICFAVPSVKSNKNDDAVEDMQIEIQVIDKTKTAHSIGRSDQTEWRENTQYHWPRIHPTRTNLPHSN